MTRRAGAGTRNPLEVYRLLPRTNCGKCLQRTCMAFAGAVLRGEAAPERCPDLEPSAAARIAAYLGERRPVWHELQEELRRLRAAVAGVDFEEASSRLGATVAAGRLAVKCLGRDFLVDREGRIASECHTHDGLAIPLLRYVVHSRGGMPTGAWTPFRGLEDGGGRAALFDRMFLQPLRGLVDGHTDLLADLMDLFAGERSVNLFGSDVSLVLYPLPRLPVLVCYWRAGDGMDSSLNVFFDRGATGHLSAEWIHSLCVGLVGMFSSIARRHA